MDIGHSRLLKYLQTTNDIAKMTTKHTLKIEHLEPTNIASEVPTEQRIREPNQDGAESQDGAEPQDGGASQNGVVVRADDDNDFVQVYSTVKEETTFEKGDVKLQKVTVAENVSEDTVLRNIPNPFYSGAYEEVIAGPQLMRTPGPEVEEMGCEVVEDRQTDKEQEENKSRSRIPMKTRFQQLAEKVKEKRRNEKKEENQVPKVLPRRSSIPRLKKVKTQNKRDNHENNYNTRENHVEIARKETKMTKNEETLPLDEEFDKIYDEIVVNDENVPIIDPSILIGKMTDAEELERSFEDIIQDYEENKVQPIDVKQGKSKIPLMKQKSLNEIKILNKNERRSSLKDISVDNKNDNDKYGKEINPSVQDSSKRYDVVTKKSEVYKETSDLMTAPDLTVQGKPAAVEGVPKEAIQETVKVVKPNFNSHDKGITTITKNKEKEDGNKRNPNKEPKHAYEDADRIPNSSRLVKQISITTSERNKLPEKKKENISKHPKTVKDEVPDEFNDHKEKLKDVMYVSTLISEELNVPQTEKEIPNSKSIKSKIAIFNRPESNNKTKAISNIIPAPIPDKQNILNDSISRLTVQTDKSKISIPKIRQENNITPPNTPQIQEFIDTRNNDNEVSLVPLNKTKENEARIKNNESNIESLNIDKGNELTKEVNILNSEEVAYNPTNDFINAKDIKTENVFEDKVYFTDATEDPKESMMDYSEASNKNNTDSLELSDNDFEREKEFLKGKVSKIINKLVSIDDNVKSPINEIVELPVKKSVSSRIAMFEDQTKQPTKVQIEKPATVNSAHLKPKIIDEVLKSQPARRLEPNTTEDRAVIHMSEPPNLSEANKDKNDTALKEETNIRKQAIIFIDETIQHASSIIDVDNFENTSKNDINDLASNSKVGDVSNKKITTRNQDTQRIKEKEIKRSEISNEKVIWKPKVVENYNIEDRMKKLQVKNEEAKAKPAVEVKIGNAIRGKVHQLIQRMNSMEKLDMEKTEKIEKNVISTKERPRKKSVSEKIALFENKLVTVKVDTVTAVAPNAPSETAPSVMPPVLTDRQIAKIEKLINAKSTYGTIDNMSYVTLRDGNKMPVIALGTALIDPVLLPHVISAAIDLGYRAIDTAYIYGNEKEIGDTIREKIATSNVTRKDLFIIGKLWSTFHRRDLVVKACQESLKNLGLEYFDLYLVHNPMSLKEGGDPLPKIANVLQYSEFDYLDAWYGMEDLVHMGLAKSIGVSNFNSEQIARIMDKGKIKPSVNQVECHPYLTQRNLTNFCEDRSIKLTCFGVLGSKGTPSQLKGSNASVIDDPMVKVLAAGSNMTAAQMLVRYQIDSGRTVLTKCSSAEHLWDNLQALGKRLDQTVLDALNALNRNKRTYVFKGMGDTHRNYPFKIPF